MKTTINLEEQLGSIMKLADSYADAMVRGSPDYLAKRDLLKDAIFSLLLNNQQKESSAVEALKLIAEFPVPQQDNLISANMRCIARKELGLKISDDEDVFRYRKHKVLFTTSTIQLSTTPEDEEKGLTDLSGRRLPCNSRYVFLSS